MEKKGIEKYMHAIDDMYHDINQIEGGKYIEAEVRFTQNDGGYDLMDNTTHLRMIEVNGVLEFNDDNPLAMILPSLG